MKHAACEKCGYSLLKTGYCPNWRCENYPHPESGVSLAEMEKVYPALPLFDGRRWGNWLLDAKYLCLIHSASSYSVPLSDIGDSPQLLDWIFQVTKKTWVTEKDAADLLMALDDIFDPQAKLCSSGLGSVLPSGFLQERITRRTAGSQE